MPAAEPVRSKETSPLVELPGTRSPERNGLSEPKIPVFSEAGRFVAGLRHMDDLLDCSAYRYVVLMMHDGAR